MYPSTIRKRTDLHLFHHGIPKVLVNPQSKGYKRLIYLYTLATQTLTMIKLENN
jgi:hypothetical protein